MTCTGFAVCIAYAVWSTTRQFHMPWKDSFNVQWNGDAVNLYFTNMTPTQTTHHRACSFTSFHNRLVCVCHVYSAFFFSQDIAFFFFLSLYWFLVLCVWIHIISYSSSDEGCLRKCELQNNSELILRNAVLDKSEVNHTRANKTLPTDFI